MNDAPTLHLTGQLAPTPGAGKRELRRWAKAARERVRAEYSSARAENSSAQAEDAPAHAGSPAASAEPDLKVCAAIEQSPLFTDARTVAIYLSMPGEVSVEPLLRAGKCFAAPRMHDYPEPHLTFHELGASNIELHAWGVRQPAAAAPSVPLHEIDLLIVPGLLFDSRGHRLGYGKGYYDRLLAQRNRAVTTAVGVALEALVLPLLPTGPHDLPVDHLVTELGFRTLTTGSSSQVG